jgi:repressor LexA
MQPFFPRSPKFSQQPQQVEHASSQVPFQLRPSHSITLPLYGIIAAGPSIEAIKDHSSFIEIPASLVGHGQHYALEIEGNSMTQAAIISGDIAIIRQQNHADTGDIVVALTDEGEVTLKIFRIVNNMIHLEPANPDYKTIVMPPEKISIQGKLTNIFRSY